MAALPGVLAEASFICTFCPASHWLRGKLDTLAHTQPDPPSEGFRPPWGFIIHSLSLLPARRRRPCQSRARENNIYRAVPVISPDATASVHLPARPRVTSSSYYHGRYHGRARACTLPLPCHGPPPYYVHATHSPQPALRSAFLFPAVTAAVCSAKPARAFVRAIETPPLTPYTRHDARVWCLGRRCGRTPSRAEDNGMSQTCEVR
jgi:hypothetical protein